jgi:hypothetical protein
VSHTLPRVHDGVLLEHPTQGGAIRVEADAWWAWLDRPTSRAFRFEGDAGTFTARREQQRGHLYWYAYRRVDRRLRKMYLGRSSELRMAALNHAAERLAPSTLSESHRVPTPGRGGRPDTLPRPLSSFVGRVDELSELCEVVQRTRLLSLVGTGGVGKTRLAIELARRLTNREKTDIYFVDLAPVADERLVPHSVSSIVAPHGRVAADPVDTILSALQGRPSLLLLDNCEHVVEACAALLQRTLGEATDVRVVATSREPLRVPGEYMSGGCRLLGFRRKARGLR